MTHLLVILRWMVACIILIPATSWAEEADSSVAALIQQAQLKRLASHPYWLKLLHVTRDGHKAESRYSSDITSRRFFLAPNGAHHPDEELNATLHALFDDASEQPDQHAQCRFIARYKWLKKELDWSGTQPPSVTCKQFDDWTFRGHIESVSLVFVSGYLSNPASFYGHIILKANPSRSVIPVDLLDQSVNYGAIVPDNENPVVYVAKGIFGGYQATFSNAQFYRHNHNYGENELRDMWEYELALDRDEMDQLLSHAWELLGNEFTYLFARENCAYRMSELLELVINEPLFPRRSPWVMPTMVFDRLATAKVNGHPAVVKVRRIPSRQNRFYAKFFALSAEQQKIASSIARHEIDLNDPRLKELPEDDQIGIIDMLIDYNEFRIIAEEKDTEYKRTKTALLIQRSKLRGTASPSESDATWGSSPPHLGPLPSMARAGWINNSQLGAGIELQFRPAYYDLLTSDTGRIANSKLTMFELKGILTDEELRLRSLSFVDIETLNLSQTNLPGDGGFAWKLKFGLDSQDLSCNHCTIFSFNGGGGIAKTLTRTTSIYGMVEGTAQTSHDDSGTLATIARVSLLGTPTRYWKSGLSVGRKRYLNQSQKSSRLIGWENRFGNSRHWDLRVNYMENVARELQISGSYYW